MLEEPIYSRDTGEPINEVAFLADQEADTECGHHPDRILANWCSQCQRYECSQCKHEEE